MPSKVIIIVIEFMFLGINIFWALLRAHFNPRLTARAKMTLSRSQNIFMPADINSIVLLTLPFKILQLKKIISQTCIVFVQERANASFLSCSYKFIISLSFRLGQPVDGT